jgi:hypothetical protein
MQEFYGTKARMKNFDACIRVDVVGERVVVGTLLSLPDMAKRRNYVYVNRVTIKSNVASIMLRQAGLLPPRPGMCVYGRICTLSGLCRSILFGYVLARLVRRQTLGYVLRFGNDPARVGRPLP